MTSLRVFTKTTTGVPPDYFAAEARGRDFLEVAGGPPLPAVLEVGADRLQMEWVEPGHPSRAAAEDFGRALARMHRAAPGRFGASAGGFVGPLPLDNTPAESWPAFYAERRLAPYLPTLPAELRRCVEAVCARIGELSGPAEQPARVHGDLWSGNVHWGADGRVWLIDTSSAHGGHRETDLAMLQLFGAPHLEVILSAYDDEWPLADGWRDRTPLHQLHPLLVHAVLFGGGYVDQAMRAADAALAH